MDLIECREKIMSLMKDYVPTWSFNFDNAKRRFGCTHYNTSSITLSRSLCEMNDWETVRLTVLHEIAHAIVGPGHGHDWIWKSKCLEIGGDGNRCYDSQKINTPSMPYVAICPKCGAEHKKMRKPKRKVSCGLCCKTFSKDRILNFVKVNKLSANTSLEVSGQYAFAF